MGPRLEPFQSDADGLWYWHLIGGNGENMGRSSEGYQTEEHAREGIDNAKAAVREINEIDDAQAEADDVSAGDTASPQAQDVADEVEDDESR